jgi:hypothetical protein
MKTFMRLTLLLLFAVAGLAGTPPSDEPWFKVQFMQDDKVVEVVNHVVKLKKDKFSILVSLKNGGNININASLDSVIYDMAREGKELPDFECFLPGTGMAEGLENKENDMSINSTAHNYWYYDDDKKHRFNKIAKNNEWITGERVVKKIWVFDNEISDQFKVSSLPRDTFYMVFMKTTVDPENTKELQREYIKVILEK